MLHTIVDCERAIFFYGSLRRRAQQRSGGCELRGREGGSGAREFRAHDRIGLNPEPRRREMARALPCASSSVRAGGSVCESCSGLLVAAPVSLRSCLFGTRVSRVGQLSSLRSSSSSLRELCVPPRSSLTASPAAVNAKDMAGLASASGQQQQESPCVAELCSSAEGLCDTVVGVLGGGQLGRMLCQAASPMGIRVAVLDPLDNCPASSIAFRHAVGSFRDTNAVREFAKGYVLGKTRELHL